MAYLLVVDDDVDFASAEATVLRDAGHEVDIEHDIKNKINNTKILFNLCGCLKKHKRSAS